MFSFFKTSVPETLAAASFVNELLVKTREKWPEVVAALAPVLEDSDREALDDKWAPLEFALACISMEVQAVRNLLPSDQAARILVAVRQTLDIPALEGAALEGFEAYDGVWQRSLSVTEPPFLGVASEFYDRVGLEGVATVGTSQYRNPVLLAALAGAMGIPARAWWKTFLSTRRLSKG